VLRSPDHLVAAIPFLLGFLPRSSLVLIWLHAGCITLTQRVDLPADSSMTATPFPLTAWVQSVVRAARHAEADALLAVAFPDAGVQANEYEPLMSELCRCALDREITMVDALVVHEDQWWRLDLWSATFRDAARVLDPQIAAEVREDFVASGWTHADDRCEVADEFTPDTGLQAVVAQQLALLPMPRNAERETWRDSMVSRLQQLLTQEQRQTPVDLAALICGLDDIRVRDCILWQLAQCEDLTCAAKVLRSGLVSCPAGMRAPVGTVAAITAWLRGDGVRATSALDLALADDASYGLALLVSAALTNGLPPRMWRETMDQLSYEACRYGSQTGNTAAP